MRSEKVFHAHLWSSFLLSIRPTFSHINVREAGMRTEAADSHMKRWELESDEEGRESGCKEGQGKGVGRGLGRCW